MKSKTIIAIYGTSNTGKSETVKKTCEIILNNFPDAHTSIPLNEIDFEIDIYLIVRIGKIKIGFASQGDPNSDMIKMDTIGNLAKEGCHIILCTTRTGGMTVKMIDSVASKYDYYTLWISSFFSPQDNSKPLSTAVLNRIAAENIVGIIKSLIAEEL